MALPFSDDFNRADEDPLSGGGNWSQASGANGPWRVRLNQANNGTGSSPWASAVDAESPNSDHGAKARGTDLSNSPSGIAIRIQTTGGLDCYVMCGRSTTIQRMFEVNSGSFTQLGSDFGETISTASYLHIEAEGSTLTFKVDGSTIGTRTDSTHTGGKFGLAGTVSQNYDDFTGYNLPTIDQSAFRFWNDDAAEASMTGAAAENTALTATANTKKILRFEIEANGDPDSKTFKVKYQKNGTGGYSDLPVGATSDVTPSPGTDTATLSGNNTASGSWAVSVPSYASGALVIIGISWDDSTTTTDVTPPSGPNGETLTAVNTTPATDASTETRSKVWYYVSTASYAGGTLTFTPDASESWTAAVVALASGQFDSTTPVGASQTAGATGTAESNVQHAGSWSAGSTDGGGRLFVWTSADTDPQTVASGFTQIGNQDIGVVSGGMFTRDTTVSDSESFSATTVSTIASDSWASVAFVVRPGTQTNDWYIEASSNIADAGTDVTTNRLTTSGKTFQAGWRIDSGYSSAPSFPAINLTSDYHTELDVCVNSKSGLADGQYAEFRVYDGDTALAAYDYTPKWTIGSGAGDPEGSLIGGKLLRGGLLLHGVLGR